MNAKALSESDIPKARKTLIPDARWGSFSRIENVKETYKVNRDTDDSGNKKINNYILLKELGRGVHGKVKLCRDSTDGTLWALKVLEKQPKKRIHSKLSKAYRAGDGNEYLTKIHREVAILKKCLHPNIIALKEVINDPDSDKIYIVLEYMEGGELKWFSDDTRNVD